MKIAVVIYVVLAQAPLSFAMEASLPLSDCKECQLLMASQANLINGKGKLNSSNLTNVLGTSSGSAPAAPATQGVNK